MTSAISEGARSRQRRANGTASKTTHTDGHGVYITSRGGGRTGGNTVEGNYIGVGSDGGTPLGNAANGVFVEAGADGNTIGGTVAAARNVISANGGGGFLFTIRLRLSVFRPSSPAEPCEVPDTINRTVYQGVRRRVISMQPVLPRVSKLSGRSLSEPKLHTFKVLPVSA